MIGALLACAATQASVESERPGCEEAAETVSLAEACADESSLIALCEGGQCELYRCREVMEYLPMGSVVLTRGGGLSLPRAQGAQRFWGSAQKLPQGTQPVFIIPWNHKPPLLPSQQKMLEEAAKERNKPRERHHVFSQEFRPWFERKKINVDEFTILLEQLKHRSIHRGERGGPWNAAWRKWILANDNATKEEIFRYAGQLIYEFELFGPVMPYWKQPPPLPPGY
ncbi:MAG: TIGR02269 family lipoprotein [Myxococcaceae bacterium]|nr:TIGR02269 family lipoprotein [Myxococcaceae bacterium]